MKLPFHIQIYADNTAELLSHLEKLFAVGYCFTARRINTIEELKRVYGNGRLGWKYIYTGEYDCWKYTYTGEYDCCNRMLSAGFGSIIGRPIMTIDEFLSINWEA